MKRAAPWILLLFALCYYGSYYRCGLYPSGEGGVEGMTALRLLSGKIPITEVALNYNVLWFYPLVGLFKIFGPSYTIIRIFFFALATFSGLLAFKIIKMTTQCVWLGFLGGVLTLLLPGQLFRNYMAFVVILNMATFLKAIVLPCRGIVLRLLWMMVAGLSLGLTFLIRIDLGFFLSVILFGLILLYPWIDSLREDAIASLKSRYCMTAAALFLAVSGFLALHLPVYNDAVQRGFAPAFAAQYQQWPHMIVSGGTNLFRNLSSKLTVATTPTSTSHLHYNKAITKPVQKSISGLTRRSFTSADIREQLMAFNLYLPILCALLLGLMVLGFLFLQKKTTYRSYPHRAMRLLPKLASTDEVPGTSETQNLSAQEAVKGLSIGATYQFAAKVEYRRPEGRGIDCLRQPEGRDERERASQFRKKSIILLTCLGCSLTLFPQYFFWRPDMVHLSEFMVPMTVTLLIAIAFAWQAWKQAGAFLRLIIVLVLISTCSDLILYFINGCQSQSTGGIAISQGRTKEFIGANGVRVKLTPNEFEEATAISQSILQHSNPGEYVICYPYNPEINFMTDRPSYRRDFYSDDITASKNFDTTTISEIERHRPAVIVVTDWPINGTEHSRFTHWAAETYQYLQTHYRADYEKGIIHVFVRPDALLLP